MKSFKYYLICALTFAVFTGTVVGMEGEKKKTGFFKRIQNVLLKKEHVKKLQEELMDPFNLPDLPKELKENIIMQLITYTKTDDFYTAINTINALSLVNKELYAYFNDDNFIAQLIDHLAFTFGRWKEQVASMLAIPAAKRYLQKRLQFIGTTTEQDLFLLIDDSINVNIPINDNGNTVLMLAAITLNTPKIKALLKNKRLTINQQNNNGDTALHLVLYKILQSTDNTEIAALKKIALRLIEHKTNVNIKNNSRTTALQLIDQINDQAFSNKVRAIEFMKQTQNFGI